MSLASCAWALASRLLMRVAVGLLGAQQAAWADAMRAEMAAIEDPRQACAFAWGCIVTALGLVFTSARAGLGRAQALGVLACSATVLLGCAFMLAAGAPRPYVWMNLLSLTLAVVTFGLLPRQRLQADDLLRARLSCVMGAVLLLVGAAPVATGEAGWLRIGPVPVNLCWLLWPALLVAADVRSPSPARQWATGGLGLACLALVLMAQLQLLALTALVLTARAWQSRCIGLAGLAGASWATTLLLAPGWQAPETLAFVDGVVSTGFEQGLVTGFGLLALQVLPLLPALRHRQAGGHGLVWGLLVLLSLPGWLPSPLLGCGGSFIVGYLLSLALLPAAPAGHKGSGSSFAPAPFRRPPAPWHRTTSQP